MGTRRRGGHEALPVRLAARLAGLSPDVIRAWEKRYGVVTPIRGPRGARLYGTEDVRRLRVLGRLVATGRRIGDLAARATADLEALAATERTAPAPDDAVVVARVLAALERFEAETISRTLGEALVALGATRFVAEIAGPLLTEVGARWEVGRLGVADEHLLAALLRDLLGALVHSRPRRPGPRIVLAAPAGERHELGLVMVALLAQDAGLEVYFLGGDLPAGEIARAAQRARAAVVGLATVHDGNRARAVAEVAAVARALPATSELWLGGRDARGVAAGVRRRTLVLDDLGRVAGELQRVRDHAGRAVDTP